MAEILPDESNHWSTGSFLFYFLVTLILTYVIKLAIKQRKLANLINKIPGLPGMPLIGNIFDFNGDNEEIFDMITKVCQYGDGISKIWMGPKPYVILYKARTAEVILGSQKHLMKGNDYHLVHDWLGNSLITAHGDKWHTMRKMLTPAFHMKILGDFIDVFNQQSVKFLSKLEKHVNQEPFDIRSYIILLTLDIIMETAMGCQANIQDNAHSEYLTAVSSEVHLFQQRAAKPWLKTNLGMKLWNYEKRHRKSIEILHSFSLDAIQKRKAEYKKNQSTNIDNKEDEILDEYNLCKKKRLAFLDLLIENSGDGTVLSDEDIRCEVDTFVFAGHDTTAAGIGFTTFLLACHPECQKLVHEELDAIFGDSDRPATMDDIREMKYTECCIKEALRLYPSIALVQRTLQQDVEIDGYTIPAGITISVMIHTIHRDPEQFPNPELFDPDRFLPENCTKRHPYAYVPFSAGPRNCIGQRFALMEEKVVLSSLFRKYRVESEEKLSEFKVFGEIVTKPVSGKINVKLFKRAQLS